ncbi:MAG: transposase [Nitrospirales bacterium]|nr:transposase [Nitrospirales bacterium]
MENAFIESFNGRWRNACLNIHQFQSLDEARTTMAAWRLDYTQRRPHNSLGHLTLNEFVKQHQGNLSAEAPSVLVKTCPERGPLLSIANIE